MYREVFKYGLAMTILMILLKVLEYRLWIQDIPLELMILIFAMFFTILGAWVGLKLSSTRILNPNKDLTESLSSEDDGHTLLSARELEVLQLLASGRSNDEIASSLFISINTVKTHISNLYLKLEVKRRTEAIRKARNLNIIKD